LYNLGKVNVVSDTLSRKENQVATVHQIFIRLVESLHNEALCGRKKITPLCWFQQ